MTHTRFAAGLCLAALSLAACEGRHDMAANRGVCFDFRAAKPAPAAANAAAAAGTAAPVAGADAGAVEDCVRRWAYSLASSRDPAQSVADATVAACSSPLARWNEQSLTQGGAPVQAPSITTGEPTNPMAEHSAFARGRALLYVVQARAGRCAPPPATNGLPQGVTG